MHGLLRVLLPLVSLALVSAAADAREIKSVTFEVVPASSVALRFEPEKVEWVLGKVRIKGKVKNHGPDDYKWVEVVYRALDRNRELLGEEVWHVTPFDLDSGKVGIVDGDLIYTRGRIPTYIQVQITGDPH